MHGYIHRADLVNTLKSLRDSGILHALLEIETQQELFGHPVYGAPWEGFVIENIVTQLFMEGMVTRQLTCKIFGKRLFLAFFPAHIQ